MPLESIRLDARPNVNRISTEMPEEHVESEVEKKWKALKESDFYNKERDIWNDFSLNEGVDKGPRHRTQLAGLILEAQFDPEKAAEKYWAYRNILINKEFDLITTHPNQDFGRSYAFTRDQLWDVLTMAQFDKAAAEKRYQKLKATELFNKEKSFWNNKCNIPSMRSNKSDYVMDNQFLDICIKLALGDQTAQEDYQGMKQNTDLFYSGEGIGYWAGRKKGSILGIGDQLEALYIESQFDPIMAKKRLEQLKQSALYDKERKEWVSSYDNWRRRTGENQIMGLLIENELKKADQNKAKENDQDQIPPKIRDF